MTFLLLTETNERIKLSGIICYQAALVAKINTFQSSDRKLGKLIESVPIENTSDVLLF